MLIIVNVDIIFDDERYKPVISLTSISESLIKV